MTWALARAQIVSIVEGVTPPDSVRPSKARGRGDRYRHRPSVTDESLPDTRGFWVRSDGLSVSKNTPTGSVIWRRDGAVISVAYRRDVEAQDLDDAIVADYEAIVAALADPANWGRPSSTILGIGAEGADRYFTARIDDVEGARILRISLDVEHRQ